MKDYYKILGVEEEASGEEIRARWVELTKHYHPDLKKANEADEKIKEINEAYEVLKNKSTRLEYDLWQALKKAHRRKRKMNRQKIILPAGVLLFFLIVGFVIFRGFHVTAPPKSGVLYKTDKVLDKKTASQIPPAEAESKVMGEKEVPKEIKEVMPQETAKIVSIPSPPSPSPKEESKRKEDLVPQVVMKSEMPVKAGKDIPKKIRKEIPQERTEIASAASSPSLSLAEKESKRKEEPARKILPKSEMPVKVDKGAPKEATEVTLQPGKKLQLKTKEEKEVPKEAGKVASRESAENVPQETVKIDKPKPIVTEPRPVQKPETSVKADRLVTLPPPLLAKEEEVRQFFSNYINRYNRKDIDGFLSFFSSRATQNQKDGFEGIRKIYTNFFDQSDELKYRLEDAKIEIYQNTVEAKARFRVDQKLKRRGEEKIWKGNIVWVLVKEDGVLKIITLDYQNEKSP